MHEDEVGLEGYKKRDIGIFPGIRVMPVHQTGELE
jgi:hypothetical protein